MRDNRHARDYAPYGISGGSPEAHDVGYGYGDYSQQPHESNPSVGFTKHQPSNSRRSASEGLISSATRRIGTGISNLIGNRSQKQQAKPTRPSRAASTDNSGDYLGVGSACRSCGRPVGPAQTRCPHCGAFVRPLYQNIFFWVAIVIFVALVVILTIVINSCSPSSSSTPDTTEPVNPINQPEEQEPAVIDRNSLSSAVSTAQAVLDNQNANHTYTRYSASQLQAAVDDANGILLDSAATDGQIEAAYHELDAANSALAELSDSYTTPDYTDLSTNLSSYLGQQISLSGTALIVTANDNGTVSVQMAVSGDSNAIAYVDYLPEDATGELFEGGSFTVNGTVSHEAYGSPVIQADRIEVQ